MNYLTADDIREELRKACQPSQAAWARENGFSNCYVSQVITGSRDVSEKISSALGFEKKVIFISCSNANG